MTKKDEANFYFYMMISLAIIVMSTVSMSMGLVIRIIMLMGLIANLYLFCKTSKELKEEEAGKKAEAEAQAAGSETTAE